jgi:cytochrome c556
MTPAKPALYLCLLLAGGMALAEAAAKDPDAHARQVLMDGNGVAAKVLADMASGATAFDPVAAAAAKAQLMAGAAEIAAKFTNHTEDPASHARPSIWSKWDDFTAKAADMGKAAAALDSSGLNSVAAGMAVLGPTCGACHKVYKAS